MTIPKGVKESDWEECQELVNSYLRRRELWLGPSGYIYDERVGVCREKEVFIIKFSPGEIMDIVREDGVDSLLLHINLRRCFS